MSEMRGTGQHDLVAALAPRPPLMPPNRLLGALSVIRALDAGVAHIGVAEAG